MTGYLLFMLAMVVIVVAILYVSKNLDRIKRVILDRLNISPAAEQHKPHEPKQPVTESESKVLTAEDKSRAELERLEKLIKDRKKSAWETDISHHLWNLYETHFLCTDPQSMERYNQDDKWYDLKIGITSFSKNLQDCDTYS